MIIHTWTVSWDILEITVHAKYVEQLMIIIHNVHKTPKFNNFNILKIRFDAMDESNIGRPDVKNSAKEVFQKRMQPKLAFMKNV